MMTTTVADVFKLTRDQCSCLGTHNDVFEKNTGLEIINLHDDRFSFFTCMDAEYTCKGQARFVGFTETVITSDAADLKVVKRRDGNGFFPTWASAKIVVKVWLSDEYWNSMKNDFDAKYVSISYEKPFFTIEIRPELAQSGTIIVDFGCHNCGTDFKFVCTKRST